MRTSWLLQRLARFHTPGNGPVFIVAAPCAGASLVASLLTQADHSLPASYTGPSAPALPAARSAGRHTIIDHAGANALRVPALAAAFPAARFLFVAREPRQQLAHMIGAWRSAPALAAWRCAPALAAAQWSAITATLLGDLAGIQRGRWAMLRYESLLADPCGMCQALGEFTGLRWRCTPSLAEALAKRPALGPADLDAAEGLLPEVEGLWLRLQAALHVHELRSANPARRAARGLPAGLRRTIAGGSLAAALLGASLAPAQVARAATFTVSSLADSGPGSLRQAIADANTAAGADVITFQNGLSGSITLTSGQLDISDSVEIRGPGASVITVSGNDSSGVFSIYSYTATPDVSIAGLTIAGGNAEIGAGISSYDAALTLDGVTITGNSASDCGGGIWADGPAMTLTIRDSIISGNTTDCSGGGVYIGYTGGLVLIEDTQITGNTASSGGGGIYFYDTVDTAVTIRRSTISGNQALAGGGLFVYGQSGSVTIESTTIADNAAAAGGGLFAPYHVGAITLENSTISGNQAIAGPGGGMLTGYTSLVSVRHSTIASNSSADSGGGIGHDIGQLSISHSIVADNIAPTDSDVTQAPPEEPPPEELLADWRPGKGADGRRAPRATPRVPIAGLPLDGISLDFSLVESLGATTVIDNGGNIIGQDPQLGPLQDNGGPTQTHLSAATSPAVNAGNPAFTPPPAADQRGLNRVGGGRVDIGAVEFSPGTLELSATSVSVSEGAGPATLTVTRAGGSDGAATLDFAAAGVSATAGSDFAPTAGSLSWAGGDASARTISIPITDDALAEPNETLTLALSNAQGASLGSATIATVTIVDDDAAPPSGFRVFLPQVVNGGRPDLVVTGVGLTPDRTSFSAGEPVQISVTIANQGSAAAAPFWADMYLNPAGEPAVNRIWSLVCGMTPCYGIAWGVVSGLAPGQSVTLTSTLGSYDPGHTIWPGGFASGTTRLVVLADSYNPASADGAVPESNEANNTASLSLTVAGPNPTSSAPAAGAPSLPERPAVPES